MANKLFIVIVFSILGLQIILVTFTSSAFQVYSNFGLTVEQWGICIGIGFLSMPVNLLLKVKTLHNNEEKPVFAEKKESKEVELVEVIR